MSNPINSASYHPRILVGVRQDLTVPQAANGLPGDLGLEIKDGIGVSLDGRSLVIADSPLKGTWRIQQGTHVSATLVRDNHGTHLESDTGRKATNSYDLTTSDGQVRITCSGKDEAEATVADDHIALHHMAPPDPGDSADHVLVRDDSDGEAWILRGENHGIEYSDDKVSVGTDMRPGLNLVMSPTSDGVRIETGSDQDDQPTTLLARFTSAGFVLTEPGGALPVVVQKTS